jgi:hypothetical protein
MQGYSPQIESIEPGSREKRYSIELSEGANLENATNSLRFILEIYFGPRIGEISISDTSIPFELKKRKITATVNYNGQDFKISYELNAAEDYRNYIRFSVQDLSKNPNMPLNEIFEAL